MHRVSNRVLKRSHRRILDGPQRGGNEKGGKRPGAIRDTKGNFGCPGTASGRYYRYTRDGTHAYFWQGSLR